MRSVASRSSEASQAPLRRPVRPSDVVLSDKTTKDRQLLYQRIGSPEAHLYRPVDRKKRRDNQGGPEAPHARGAALLRNTCALEGRARVSATPR